MENARETVANGSPCPSVILTLGPKVYTYLGRAVCIHGVLGGPLYL